MTDSAAEEAVAAATTRLQEWGYRTERREHGRRPAAVGTPGPAARTLLPDRRGDDGDGPRPVAVEPVRADADPAAVVDAVAHAMRETRLALFVPVEGAGADGTGTALARPTEVLTDPPAARAEREDGSRELYALPDRIHLDGGGLAMYEAGGPVTASVPDPRWREAPPGDGPAGDGGTAAGAAGSAPSADPAAAEDGDGGTAPAGDAGEAPSATDRTGTDRRRLVFEDGDRTVAVLESADELACPGPDPAAFPFRYRRTEDKRFAVHDREGRLVGTFTGVRAMRRSGLWPVPEPLVPAFVLPGRPTDAWATLDADDGCLRTATGERPLPGGA